MLQSYASQANATVGSPGQRSGPTFTDTGISAGMSGTGVPTASTRPVALVTAVSESVRPTVDVTSSSNPVGDEKPTCLCPQRVCSVRKLVGVRVAKGTQTPGEWKLSGHCGHLAVADLCPTLSENLRDRPRTIRLRAGSGPEQTCTSSMTVDEVIATFGVPLFLTFVVDVDLSRVQ